MCEEIIFVIEGAVRENIDFGTGKDGDFFVALVCFADIFDVFAESVGREAVCDDATLRVVGDCEGVVATVDRDFD